MKVFIVIVIQVHL